MESKEIQWDLSEFTQLFYNWCPDLGTLASSFALSLHLLLGEACERLFQFLYSIWDVVDFMDLSPSVTNTQLQLLRVLSAIVMTHMVLIYFVWKKYGEKINERFFKPAISASAMHEQLRKAVQELKLPAEHTPRI